MWAERWFGLLLRLFPARFRARHGEAMRGTFSRTYAEHRARGRLMLAAFLVRTSLDMAASGVRARLSGDRARGVPERRREAGRRGGFVSWIDVKLGLRMLRKHPGLTLVSTFALAVGIPVGLAPAHFVDGIMAPLPVPAGEDIRSLRLWNARLGRAATPTYRDFDAWRTSLSSFEPIGAFREVAYNVDPGERGGAAVRGAEVTASAFEVLRVRPLLGRAIQPADEIPGADRVAVIGYDLWQARYRGDTSIVGRSIRLGATPHTVVGVMPEGFLFPRRQSLWTPLTAPSGDVPESSLAVQVFGRLRVGVADDQARAEFALVGQRSPRPGRDPGLQPQVEAYAHIVLPGLNGGLRGTQEFLVFQSLALVVLLVAGVNVGMLIFARTATRASEMAVRTALGASRARIVAQVFVECLVLAVLASGAGLALMAAVLGLVWRFMPVGWATALPYWIDWGIGAETVLHALGLAVVSAAVAGVVPTLRFTGRSVQSNIQRARARRSGVRFGGLSGVLIVADVAVAVVAVGFAVTASDLVRRAGTARDHVGVPADEYLAATIRFPRGATASEGGPAALADRSGSRAATQERLVRKLRAEPGVRAVAVADALPRMDHRTRLVEAEGVEAPGDRRGVSTRAARVAVDFFESLDRTVLAGRGFEVGDLTDDRSSVIVNTTFVERVLGGQNAVGRRIRFVPWGDGQPGPWKEIVGVVGHLGMRVVSAESDQGVYEPFAPGELEQVRLAIHVGDDPGSFASRLRVLAGQVDPSLIVSVTGPLDDVYEGDWYIVLAASVGAALLVGVLLALAASGLYAIMSFAVAERTTEIGIRAALGAGRRELVLSVARRAVLQLALGVLLGIPVAAGLLIGGDGPGYVGVARTLTLGVAVMLVVGLAACTGPTLRALRVDPSEALRAEG
ncbi:MAG: ABC transporter permease [Gemmatimonadota bacterium]|jgi:predicted permease